MTSKDSVRRLAALGAGLAMAATMVTGLMAAPAAAAGTGTIQAAKPKVSVATPKASPKRYEGECPVKVVFSAKVKVKPTRGKTRVVYRWLHGDGSKSKVKSYTFKGKRTKTLTFKETATFKKDIKKNWQALQVLSPRKVKSKKGYFSVNCGKEIVLNPVKRDCTKNGVTPDQGERT